MTNSLKAKLFDYPDTNLGSRSPTRHKYRGPRYTGTEPTKTPALQGLSSSRVTDQNENKHQ